MTNNIKLFLKSLLFTLGIITFSFLYYSDSSLYAANEQPEELSLVQLKPTGEMSEYGRRPYGYFDENGKSYTVKETSDIIQSNLKKQESLPASYDLREEHMVTSVKDQKDSGTCWAFAAIGSIESYALKNTIQSVSTEPDLSELHLAWFSYNLTSDTSSPLYDDGKDYVSETAMEIGTNNPLDWGGYFQTAVATLAAWQGVETEYEMPFSNYKSNLASYSSKRFDSVAHLQNANILMGTLSKQDEATKNTIKSALMNNGALQLSYYSSDNNSYYHKTSAGTAYYQKNYVNTAQIDYSNHSVLLVGWDDNFSKNNFYSGARPANDGAWLIRNSWGTSSLDQGYFWLSYEDKSICDIVTMEVENTDNYDHNYQYDGFLVESALQITTDTTYANVFSTNNGSTELLEAVSFQTIDADVPYTIEIYKNLSGTAPSSGTLVSASTMNGTIAYPGYHTVRLNSPIEIQNNSRFAVAVTFHATQTKSLLYPIESDGYSSKSGQSFYYSNSTKKWTDLRTITSAVLHNVPIKAFTSDTDSTSVTSEPTQTPPNGITPSPLPQATASATVLPTITPISIPTTTPIIRPTTTPTISPTVLPSLPVSAQKLTLGIGEKYDLRKLKHLLSTYGKVNYFSDNNQVASVSQTGLVTAKKTGSCSIIGKNSSYQNTLLILTIKRAPTKITLTAKTKTLRLKKTYQIKIKALSPKASTSYHISYRSSKTKVATVSTTGKVTARKRGSATITVSTYNGKKAKIKLKVKP